jgi:hypothetical protein
MTLVQFLCDRLDDEEALAVAAIRSGERPDPAFASLGDHGSVSTSGHNLIVRCDSRRRIVEAYMEVEGLPEGEQQERRETLAWVLRQLALPYASHPDYRDEWHPEADSATVPGPRRPGSASV